jgi:PAS domain-containing protein
MRIRDNSEDNLNRDFVPRSYMKPFIYTLPVAATCCILALLSWVFGWAVASSPVAMLLLVLSVIATMAVIWVTMKNNEDTIMEHEFQNLLFASAMASRCDFCMFIKRDGSIVYANGDAQTIFPQLKGGNNSTLDRVLESNEVDTAVIERLYQGLNQNKHSAALLDFGANDDGSHAQYIIELQPLKRPFGYSVVQGREFVDKRRQNNEQYQVVQEADMFRLHAMADGLPFGVYLTSASGVIEYTNGALNQLLRYEDGQSPVADNLTVQRLVYHADGFETLEFEVCDFKGEAMLSCKNEALKQVQLYQFALYDNEHKLIGFAGLVNAE